MYQKTTTGKIKGLRGQRDKGTLVKVLKGTKGTHRIKRVYIESFINDLTWQSLIETTLSVWWERRWSGEFWSSFNMLCKLASPGPVRWAAWLEAAKPRTWFYFSTNTITMLMVMTKK